MHISYKNKQYIAICSSVYHAACNGRSSIRAYAHLMGAGYWIGSGLLHAIDRDKWSLAKSWWAKALTIEPLACLLIRFIINGPTYAYIVEFPVYAHHVSHIIVIVGVDTDHMVPQLFNACR